MYGLKQVPIFKRLYWKGLHALGMQEEAWDQLHEKNIWAREGTSQYLLDLISQAAPESIIEFGCGDGEFASSQHCQYIGFDMSAVAIQKARRKNLLAKNCAFYQLDMRDWKGESVDLIVLEESLYYLRPREIVRFLNVCFESLTEKGRVIVVVHDYRKYRKLLELCMALRERSQLHRTRERCYLVLQKSVD